MRLYNAQSCTPVGTLSSHVAPASRWSPPKSFLPPPSLLVPPSSSSSPPMKRHLMATSTKADLSAAAANASIMAASTNSTDDMTPDAVESQYSILRNLDYFLEQEPDNAAISCLERQPSETSTLTTLSTLSTKCSIQETPVLLGVDAADETFSAVFGQDHEQQEWPNNNNNNSKARAVSETRQPWPHEIADEPLSSPATSDETQQFKTSSRHFLASSSPTKVILGNDFRAVRNRLRKVAAPKSPAATTGTPLKKIVESRPLELEEEEEYFPTQQARFAKVHSPKEAIASKSTDRMEPMTILSAGFSRPTGNREVTNRSDWQHEEEDPPAILAIDTSPSSSATPIVRDFQPFDLPKEATTTKFGPTFLTEARADSRPFAKKDTGRCSFQEHAQALHGHFAAKAKTMKPPSAMEPKDCFETLSRMPRQVQAAPSSLPPINKPNPPSFGQDAGAENLKPSSHSQVDLSKYTKMIKMGLPMGAVQNAMLRDGLDPCALDNGSCGRQPAKKVSNKDKFRRTRLYWESHNGVRSNTVWGMVKRDPDVAAIQVSEDDLQLFRSEITTARPAAVASSTTTTACGVKVIDAKRANNGGIILARVKLSHNEIARAVDTFDYDVMTPEQICGILHFVPTKEESLALQNFLERSTCSIASLCECEKFMVAMMNVPQAKRKLKAMLFMQSFATNIEELRHDARLVQNACDEIMSSSRFRKVLGIVLDLGNRLNTAGCQTRQVAGAITLDSLLKLNQAKAFDKKTTFLHFVVKVVRENKATLVHFKEEMSLVFKAEKIQWQQLLSEMERIEKELDEVRKIALYQSGHYPGSVCDDNQTILSSSLPLNKEVEILQTSAVGRFTLDACLRMAVLVNEVEKAKEQFEESSQYFGEKVNADEVFCTIGTFARNFDVAVDQVIEQEKVKMKTLRGAKTEPSRAMPMTSKAISQDSEVRVERYDRSYVVGSTKNPFGRVLSDIKRKSKSNFLRRKQYGTRLEF